MAHTACTASSDGPTMRSGFDHSYSICVFEFVSGAKEEPLCPTQSEEETDPAKTYNLGEPKGAV